MKEKIVKRNTSMLIALIAILFSAQIYAIDITLPSQKGAALNTSEFETNYKRQVTQKTTNYTTLVGDNRDVIEVNSSGAVTITLADASDMVASADTGDYVVTVSSIGTGTTTVARTSTDTFDGETSITLTQYQAATFKVNDTGNGYTIVSRGGVSERLKDLTVTSTATFSGATIANLGTVTTADINGGTIDGTTIGGSTPAAGTFTTADINGGTIDGTTIGGSTPAAGTFTTADINGGTIDGTTIGGSTPAAGTFTTATVTTLNIGGTNVTATATELNYTDITTPGTAQESKALVTNPSKNVQSLGAVGIGSLNWGWNGATGIIDIGTSGGLVSYADGTVELRENTYYGLGGDTYKNDGYASVLQLTGGGGLIFYTGPLGTAGNTFVRNNRFEIANDGTTTINGNTGWHAGNDGSGSTLDADLLDGISSAGFYQVSGTDVAVADGGTGASTANGARENLGVYHGRVNSGGTAIRLPSGWSVSKPSTGVYTITHNLGTANYSVVTSVDSIGTSSNAVPRNYAANTFQIETENSGAPADIASFFTLIKD